ncbi:unnamed protein product [Caenorhabditis auriculariae]|uniref:RING-type domain-containing protein n=1 Tax=Caenorhabditis auriculariae TaxID=2777116 RepID=A0A8S1GNE5_9PELO|nr:unnamed protein product [Caenorhabditis auriculariae]
MLLEGSRVIVAEVFAHYAQRRNLYSQLMWTKSHLVMLGHVGIISKIDTERLCATVIVYCFVRAPNSQKRHFLAHVKTDWPLDALDETSKVYFACGDAVVLTHRGAKATMAKVTSVEFNEAGNATYTVTTKPVENESPVVLKVNEFGVIGSTPTKPCVMLPIYVGKSYTQVMRDENSPPIHNFKNTLHGYTIESLMNVISNWSDNPASYAKLVETVRSNAEQVRGLVDGELPLFRAVADNNWLLVVVLIALGASRFAKDAQMRNVVHISAQRGLEKMLEGVLMLLPNEVNRKTREGDTPLHLAARNAHAACVDRLLNLQYCQPNIQVRCEAGPKLLLQNENGDTPLHEACALAESANKKATIGRLLSNTRATIHQPNNNELSPLQISIFKGHATTVEQLVQLRPTHRNTESRSGMTPLHFAASCANVNIVNVLITTDRSVLHYVVEKWTGQADKDMARLACLQALVHAGAPLNLVDSNGHTVIHVLVREIMKEKEPLPNTLIGVCLQLVRTNLNLDEIASRLRPRWQLASICFLASKGADMMIKDRRGETVVEMCKENTLRTILTQIANLKIRSCLPMVSMKCGDFDSSEVTMCTFMCQDSIADVRFMPCGHRVACSDCAQRTAFRRCPLCYHIVSSALDNDGREVLIGSKAGDERMEKSIISEQVVRKIAEQAAREAKIAVEREKQNELKMLRERLEQLEMETSCSICMDAKITMVFNCGHTACSECAAKLKLCHICRQNIASTQTIYS